MTLFRSRAYAHAAGGAWSTAVLQFVAGVILVRSLTPHDVGTFVFASAIAAFAFGVLDLRVEEGLTQLLIRGREDGGRFSMNSAVRYAVAIDLVSGLAIFALILAGFALVPLDMSYQTKSVAIIAALTSLISSSDGSFVAVLYAQHAFGWLSAYQIVTQGTRCLALLVLSVDTPADAAWGFALAQMVGTVFLIMIVSLRFLSKDAQSTPLDSTERRWLLRFSLHVAISSAVATVRTTATPLVMGIAGTRPDVAAARVAESPTRLLGVASSPLRMVLFPRLSAAWARRDRHEARRLIRHYVATIVLLGGVLAVAIAMTMDFLLTRIYGSAYGDLERVGQLFVVAALLDALAGWQKVAPAALDRPWLRSFILVGETGTLLIALLIFVPIYGPLGAATSAIVAAAASLAMGVYWLRPVFAESSWGDIYPSQGVGEKTSIAHRSR